MATAYRAAASLPHETRNAGALYTPASAIFVSNSTSGNSANALRLQRLNLLGIIGQRAKLLSELAWETGR